MKNLLFFYFDLLRRFNNWEPSIQEVKWVSTRTWKPEKFRYLTPRMKAVVMKRTAGMSLEAIARAEGVTRERIRQILLKACRMARDL